MRLNFIEITALTLAVVAPAFSEIEDDGVIRDIYALEAKLIEAQYGVIGVSPPTTDVFWLPGQTAYPVEFAKFPQAFKKSAYAEMVDFGGVLMPVYRISIYEDYQTRETVFLDMYNQEMMRLSPEEGYDPYLWAKTQFQIESEFELDEFHRWIFDPAHLALQIDLIDSSFYPAYQEIQAELAAQEAATAASMANTVEAEDGISVSISAAPADQMDSSVLADDFMMMATSSSPPPPPGGGGGGSSTNGGSSNLVVTLNISLPESFENNYIEIYSKDDLILYTNWSLENAWVPTYGSNTVSWTDPTSSNKAYRFYLVNDGTDQDGDGRSDLYESWNGTSSNTYNHVDSDSDGMHDWWEEKLFGDLSEDADDDFDNDGLLNDEELISGQPPVMITDPSLYSSDGDSLGDGEMYASLPTDPWNPDTTTPVATITWPTNNTVLTF